MRSGLFLFVKFHVSDNGQPYSIFIMFLQENFSAIDGEHLNCEIYFFVDMRHTSSMLRKGAKGEGLEVLLQSGG